MEHTRGECLRAREVRVRTDDEELLAAPSRGHVIVPDSLFQRPRECHENGIAHLMAEGVVDVLELVQVEHHHGHRIHPPLRPIEDPSQRPRTKPAIADSRERIGLDLLLQPRVLLDSAQRHTEHIGDLRTAGDVRVRPSRCPGDLDPQRVAGIDELLHHRDEHIRPFGLAADALDGSTQAAVLVVELRPERVRQTCERSGERGEVVLSKVHIERADDLDRTRSSGGAAHPLGLQKELKARRDLLRGLRDQVGLAQWLGKPDRAQASHGLRIHLDD